MANLFFNRKGSDLLQELPEIKEPNTVVLNNIIEPRFPKRNFVARSSVSTFRFTVKGIDFILRRLFWGSLIMFLPAIAISHLDKCLEVEQWIQHRLGPRLANSPIINERLRLDQEEKDKLSLQSSGFPVDGDSNPQPFGQLTTKKIKFICDTAKQYGISCTLAVAVNMVETSGNPWIGSWIAIGSMQVTWETAKRECGSFIESDKQLWDFEENVKCGMLILNNRLKEYKGDVKKAVMGYNGSPFCKETCYTHVDGKRKWYSCNYPCAETKEYADRIFNAMETVSKTIGNS